MAQQTITVPLSALQPAEPITVPLEALQPADGARPMNQAFVNGQPVPIEDSPLDLVKGAASTANPLPAIQTVGKALIPERAARAMGATEPEAKSFGPANTINALLKAQGHVGEEMVQSFKEGDYLSSARHAVNWLLPVIGPVLDQAANEMAQGRPWRGAGEAIGLALGLAAPSALKNASVKVPPIARNPNPAEAAAVEFGQARGIPVDAATATGNKAVQGVQFLADRSLGGSLAATGRSQRTAQALERVGGELAENVRKGAATPEQAGAGLEEALRGKVATHTQQADTAYGRVRAGEVRPENRLDVPTGKAAVDALTPDQLLQMRRIVHELDAMPYTSRQLRQGRVGSSLEHVEGTGGEGATVYHDIIGQLESGNPTRALVQQQLEEYLAGGKETPVVKAAQHVAEERSKGRGGYTVAKPELPPSAGDVPTKLEAGRQRFTSMGLPVHMAPVQEAIRPFVEQMRRQMPLTQQQANPGLHVMQQILDGPEWVSLSQADRDLGAVKAVARQHGGLAKVAVREFEQAVSQASQAGTSDVAEALQAGRAATKAKYQTLDVLDRVLGAHGEPVQVYRKLVAPADSGVDLLRTVAHEAPQALSAIGRAYLDDLLRQATAEGGFDKTGRLQASWQQLGPQTKKLLFPKEGQIADLDKFFLLAKKLNLNPNPSGTAYVGAIGAQSAALVLEPIMSVVSQLGAAGLSTLLHSPAGVKLLTQGLSLSTSKAPRLAQVAAAARIADRARALGLLAAPATAETPADTTPAGAGR